MRDEVDFVEVLRILCVDLFVNAVDRHQERALLASFLQELLRLFFVSFHELRFLLLNLIQHALHLGYLVGFCQCLCSLFSFVLFHLFGSVVCLNSAIHVSHL